MDRPAIATAMEAVAAALILRRLVFGDRVVCPYATWDVPVLNEWSKFAGSAVAFALLVFAMAKG